MNMLFQKMVESGRRAGARGEHFHPRKKSTTTTMITITTTSTDHGLG